MSQVRSGLSSALGLLQTPEVQKLIEKHEKGVHSAGTKLRNVLNEAQKALKDLYRLVQTEREQAEGTEASLLPADGGTPPPSPPPDGGTGGGTTTESGTVRPSK